MSPGRIVFAVISLAVVACTDVPVALDTDLEPQLAANARAAKVTICHFPPGNPSNAHTITVSANALTAHLAHGDILGECLLRLLGVNSNDDGLSHIDPATGVVTFIGPLDPNPNVFVTPISMAVRPSDGKIFVWNNSDQVPGGFPFTPIPTGVLLTVDPATGLATRVDATTPNQGQLSALAFAPDGRLFGLDRDLFEIDPATGVLTSIGSLGLRVAAADFDASGTLFGVELAAGAEKLVTINTSTGATTLKGTLTPSILIVGSIVFDPTGTLIGSTAGPGPPFSSEDLFDIDPSTGATSNFRTLSGPGSQGMGFAR